MLDDGIDKDDLLSLLQDAAKFGKFILSSGKESDFYLDARLVTMSPLGASIISGVLGKLLSKQQWKAKMAIHKGLPNPPRLITAIGGPATAACPIVTAASIGAFREGVDIDVVKRPLKAFYVRSEPKNHGTKKLIEGAELGPDDYVVLFDDVATSGGSLLKALAAVRATGATCERAIVLVDRFEGAGYALAAEGVCLDALFTRKDLAREPQPS